MFAFRALLFRLLIALSLLAPHGASSAQGGLVICGADGPALINWAGPGETAPAKAATHHCCKSLCAAASPPAPFRMKGLRLSGPQARLAPRRPGAALSAPAGFSARAPPFASV